MSEALPLPEDVPDPLSALAEPIAATRYDVPLGVILAAFVATAVVTFAIGLRSIGLLLFPAAIGILVIVDTCYLHPPIDRDPE
ncbi:hypothetical protein [Saliphagus sp. LR7]|uniref:hypothetical protein n=1 Tax=Saliphagus sp. LR7 TaxID=2282654 RepID=UPI000DF7FA72|nr:hypothetical protein [Saliphagus sp. LR7]